ncbi:MAG: repeat-containing glycosyl hydrolase, partial [Gemmatimonadetes bacterium]|nr:repeat-containing glycosyl hydrolase [Gemmatimonadota bacterium]
TGEGASGEARGGDGPAGGRGGGDRPVRVVVLDASGDTVTTANAPGEKGLNRWVWNLRYAAPTAVSFAQTGADEGGGGRRGGMSALPGTYTVKLTANGETRTQPVLVVPDPRLPWNPAAGHAQLALARRVSHQVAALNTVVNRTHSLRGQIAAAQAAMRETGTRDPGFAARARALDQQLRALSDSLYNPDVQRGVTQDDIHYLTDFQGMLQGLGFAGAYNQAPSPLVVESATRLGAQLDRYLARYNTLVQNDVAAYNREAAAHGSPTLVAGAPVVVKP